MAADRITAIKVQLAGRPYGGEVNSGLWEELAGLEGERADAASAQAGRMVVILAEMVFAVSLVHGQKYDAERFLDARSNAQSLLDEPDVVALIREWRRLQAVMAVVVRDTGLLRFLDRVADYDGPYNFSGRGAAYYGDELRAILDSGEAGDGEKRL